MTTTKKVIALLADSDLARAQRELVAQNMQISKVTLDRRLRAEGTSFMDILTNERRRRCVDLFTMNPHASGELVRRRCGYTEINSAYRGFIQIFGVSVSDVKLGRASIS